LALLLAPLEAEAFLKKPGEGVHIRTVALGASQGAFEIEANDAVAARRIADKLLAHLRRISTGDPYALFPFGERNVPPPYAHLGFSIEVVAIDPATPGDDLAAVRRAVSANRFRQIETRCWDLPVRNDKARGGGHQSFDAIRPATVTFEHPKTRLVGSNSESQKEKAELVSHSFVDRFHYGREMRQLFYTSAAIHGGLGGATTWADLGDFHFTNNFEHLIADPPSSVTSALRNKIAVFYADGNKFTQIRESSRDVAAYAGFSTTVRTFQSNLVKEIVAWLKSGALGDLKEAYALFDGDKAGFRFETLLWGGDELTFVMPAWLGLEFVGKFREWTKGWNASGASLTHGMGLVFCNYKTPIRSARRVANIIADLGKDAYKKEDEDKLTTDLLQIEAFESLALPDTKEQLRAYRRKLFGLDGFDNSDSVVDKQIERLLTLRGDRIRAVLGAALALKAEDGFPRSQIYRWLREASGNPEYFKQRARPLGNDASSFEHDLLDASIETYLRRAGAGIKKKRTGKALAVDDLAILGADAPLAHSLSYAAMLWDYVEPLKSVTEAVDG
jgi:hypothetical protein